MKSHNCIIEANFDQVYITDSNSKEVIFRGGVDEAVKITNNLPLLGGGNKIICFQGFYSKEDNLLIVIFDIPHNPIFTLTIEHQITEIKISYRESKESKEESKGSRIKGVRVI